MSAPAAVFRGKRTGGGIAPGTQGRQKIGKAESRVPWEETQVDVKTGTQVESMGFGEGSKCGRQKLWSLWFLPVHGRREGHGDGASRARLEEKEMSQRLH